MTQDSSDAVGPVRTCIGCREPRPQVALVRITRSPAGIIVDGASVGRGAWLCRAPGGAGGVVATCLDTAIAKRAFARAWRAGVTPEEVRQIRERLGALGSGRS